MNAQHVGTSGDPAARRRAIAVAGHRGDEPAARLALGDDDAGVRAAALAALGRMGHLGGEDIERALADASPAVRRRAVEVAVAAGLVTAAPVILRALDDTDVSVVESAAWALGELGETTPPAAGTVEALVEIATSHRDALCREAAVAALGAIGDPAGLDAILTATGDKPAVRRRAVLALAPFEGPDVEAALQAALADRDWQVRQAAEDLLD
ncbi:MAG TPA: HEAT repeat domain-containing protein [Acidimicrobiales bacterium]|nr:HEAT repeat domain-containing protein [Acidimicrobiales bacterium]